MKATHCVVEGCPEPRARMSRCVVHAREYQRAWRAAHPTYHRDYMRSHVLSPEAQERRRVRVRRLLVTASREIPVPTRERPCVEEGCHEPRYVAPGGTVKTRCRDHRAEAKRLLTCSVFYLTCAQCERLFVARSETVRGTPRRFCSRPCSTDHFHESRVVARRARMQGAMVEPVSRRRVFERDGWRCQLCRRLVRRDVSMGHLLEPTIDHIVPLSRGGTHEYRNVQTAHRKCNSKKHAGVFGHGEQLRLIG